MPIEAEVEQVEPARELLVSLSSRGVLRGHASYMLTDRGDRSTPLIACEAPKKADMDFDPLRRLVEATPVAVRQ